MTASGVRGQTGRTARRGAVLGLVAQLARQLLSVVATVVLARLLVPADFGIIAAANTILGLAAVGTMLGFGPTVIRRRDHDDVFVSTLFWSSIGISGAMAILVAAMSPYLAVMFGNPDATWYLAVLAPAIVCDVSASVPLAMLQRDLRFTALYGSITGSMAVYVAVQVGLAVAGLGAWAVIIGQLAMSVTALGSALVLARWRPRLRFAGGMLRTELGFAGAILLGHVLAYALKTVDYWVVGRALGGALLGIYYIAFQLPSIVRLRMSAVSRQVLFPVFVQEQEDPEQTGRMYRTAMRLQIGVGIPAMVGMAALAEPIIRLFFGTQWLQGVDPMRWLALAAVFEIITSPAGSIAIAHGRMRPYLASLATRLVLMAAVLVVVAVAGGGMEAIAVAMLVQSAGGAVLTQVMLARPLGLPATCVLAPLGLAVIPAAAMYGALHLLLSGAGDLPGPVLLALAVPAGAVVYVLVMLVVSRRELDFLRGEVRAFVRALSSRRARRSGPATAT